MKRYDACAGRRYTSRDGEQKTAWTRIGVAFERDGKLSCRLDALPVPNDKGEVWISFFEQRAKDEGRPALTEPRPALDDEVPF